ncbi:spermidine/putrescine ABC transporter substrate-binding protein [Micromonospora sp. DSM 115977]|uniref:Spermidine/putrescine ABC transporter substrate-binding protein n=1 Tax=Micromonospora reichwaldensis TaxID=3075516 RepID=A0ABU2X561_9ACTN|nr:spermidine/putrescine ABC transporter substrate-binding protein [Micromonospora sp. DSM 115977]MDT0532579.1 spermidine/putrescine ABC transporter substrate-binding protein [Micromonospora sp. DSM 115977]
MRTPLRPLTRRGLLTGALGSAALLAAGGSLAGCGTRAATQTEAGCVSEDLSGTEKTLTFSNWPQYMDVDDADTAKRPTLDAFVAKSGIRVTYTEDINDNREFFGKVQHQLAGCQPTGRDIMVLSDWLAARMIRLGWIQKLDKSKLPNVQANLLPSLRNRSFDPSDHLAVPWQSGLAGLAYNGRVTKEIRTVDELLIRPDLKGRVTALAEMSDTMGLLLQSNGHDPAYFSNAQFDEALAKLKKAVDSGQIRRFTGNDYAPALAKGDIAACIGWSGDAIQLGFEDDKIKFVVPESGAMLWSDNMLVPNRATHKGNAEQLVDYYYQPAVAARLAAYVNYICPVQGAQAEMEKIDPALAAHPLIFPDAAMLARTAVFMALDEKQEREYESKFQRVIGA